MYGKSDLIDLVNKLTFIGEFSLTTQVAVSAALSADLSAPDGPYDTDKKNGLLRVFTGETVKLDVHVACYPLGYPTTILFDEDGNPV